MFKFENIAIRGVCHVDAPNILSSDELEAPLRENFKRFGMPPRLIEPLTKIKTRRVWHEGAKVAEVAQKSARKILDETGLNPSDLGVLISTSVSKDYIEPSTAALVHGDIGLPSTCLNFDLGNACLAFLDGMTVASNMIEAGQIEHALIVAGESSGHIIQNTLKIMADPEISEKQFRSNFATLTLGSTSVAMILSHKKHAPNAPRFLGGVTLADTANNRLCLGTAEEMTTDTRSLLKAGVALAARTYGQAVEFLDWGNKTIDHHIMHQVSEKNISILEEILQLDASKTHRIFPDFGNVGPASIPLLLSLKQEQFKKGDRLALMGIGSGLNCSMMEVLW